MKVHDARRREENGPWQSIWQCHHHVVSSSGAIPRSVPSFISTNRTCSYQTSSPLTRPSTNVCKHQKVHKQLPPRCGAWPRDWTLNSSNFYHYLHINSKPDCHDRRMPSGTRLMQEITRIIGTILKEQLMQCGTVSRQEYGDAGEYHCC